MDVFFTLTAVAGVMLQMLCMGRLLGRRASWQSAAFVLLAAVVIALPVPRFAAITAVWLILFGYGAVVLRGGAVSSAAYSALLCGMIRLCYGITSSLTEIIAPLLFRGSPQLAANILMIFGEITALALFFCCCEIICGTLLPTENNGAGSRMPLIILIPNILIFMIAEYISNTFYSAANTEFPSGKSASLLLIQVLGTFSVFCTLFAYKRLSGQFAIKEKLAVFEQQDHFQRLYVNEAKSRYDSAWSLRHDMKNHLSVLGGLLKKGDYSRAEKYLDELDYLFSETTFRYQTGSPILDILLENKSSDNVFIDCGIRIPKSAAVSDADWCAIFANALDNAIRACSKQSSEPKLCVTIKGKVQGDFFLIIVQNPFDGDEFKIGTGLRNIARTAEKYGGRIEISTDDNLFTLKILLNISQQ